MNIYLIVRILNEITSLGVEKISKNGFYKSRVTNSCKTFSNKLWN